MEKPKVIIETFPRLQEALDKIGPLEKLIPPGAKVLIKPNLCVPKESGTGAVTHHQVVVALVELLKPVTNKIYVGDSPFAGFSGMGNLRASGMLEAVEKAGAIPVDLNATGRVTLQVPGGKVMKHLVVSQAVVEADFIINLPVMKTHVKTLVSLGLKNMKGIVPGALKHEPHKKGLDQGIVDYHKVMPPHLTVVDATYAMEGNGPVNGQARELGLVIAGQNTVAVDTVCCHIMGINPEEVGHLRLAAQEGMGPLNLAAIDVEGLSEDRKFSFSLPGTYKSGIFNFMSRFEATGTKIMEGMAKVTFDYEKCTQCQKCVVGCPTEAISLRQDEYPVIDYDKCIECLCCMETCMYDAIYIKGPTFSSLSFGVVEKLWKPK